MAFIADTYGRTVVHDRSIVVWTGVDIHVHIHNVRFKIFLCYILIVDGDVVISVPPIEKKKIFTRLRSTCKYPNLHEAQEVIYSLQL